MSNTGFTDERRERLTELLKTDFTSYVESPAVRFNPPKASIEPYWNCYGYESRTEWCAIFVSCATSGETNRIDIVDNVTGGLVNT